jgi:phosphatidylglycerophosphate synthase
LTDPPEHTRVNDIFLGPLERPALRWLAVHAPAWLTPNICTGIGVLGGVIIFLGYILSNLNPGFFWLASFGFLVNWYGDSLDGTLARYRKIERPAYGFFIDHTTDAATQVLIFVGLGLSPYISFNMACLALVGYLLLSVLAYIRTYVSNEFKISYSKLGPTEIRALAVLLNTVMFFFGALIWPVQISALGIILLNPYDFALAIVCLVLLFFFLSTATREIRRLGRLDR